MNIETVATQENSYADPKLCFSHDFPFGNGMSALHPIVLRNWITGRNRAEFLKIRSVYSVWRETILRLFWIGIFSAPANHSGGYQLWRRSAEELNEAAQVLSGGGQ